MSVARDHEVAHHSKAIVAFPVHSVNIISKKMQTFHILKNKTHSTWKFVAIYIHLTLTPSHYCYGLPWSWVLRSLVHWPPVGVVCPGGPLREGPPSCTRWRLIPVVAVTRSSAPQQRAYYLVDLLGSPRPPGSGPGSMSGFCRSDSAVALTR